MGSEIVLMLLGVIFVMILFGIHIGVALGLVSGLGVYLILGNVDAALSIIGSTAYDAIRNQIFAVIPLFVLMGEIRCGDRSVPSVCSWSVQNTGTFGRGNSCWQRNFCGGYRRLGRLGGNVQSGRVS